MFSLVVWTGVRTQSASRDILCCSCLVRLSLDVVRSPSYVLFGGEVWDGAIYRHLLRCRPVHAIFLCMKF